MKVGICINGLEDIAAEEVNGKKLMKGRVSFEEVKDYKSLILIYDLVDKLKFDGGLEIIRDVSKKLDFKGSFMIMCQREGKHKFNSGWIIGKLNKKFVNKTRKIDYKKPKNIIFVDIVDNKCLFGFLIKKDVHKRKYRVKLRGATIHPCVAYSMLKMIDYKKSESFLDPRCMDGVIAIEAALFGGKNIKAVDRNIRDARINAKIAKVEIKLAEDLKGIRKIKKIATYLPSISKIKRKAMISHVYEEFFTDMKKILSGKIAVLVEKKRLLKKFAKDFKLIDERRIFVGEAEYHILIFE